MSLRPRFAGDGFLLLPTTVTIGTLDGVPAITSTGPAEPRDPFERDEAGILLAESFARLDLAPGPALVDWVHVHGCVGVERSPATDTSRTELPPWQPGTFVDPLPLVAAEQRTVAWHLASLARITEHLLPLPGVPAGPWDPAWCHPVLDASGWHALIAGPGGPTPEPAWWDDVPANPRAAQAVAERLARRELVGRRLVDGIGDDPWSLMELQRRLLAPYIGGASEVRLGVRWDDREHRGWTARRPLVVDEQRTWQSLLTPVYVQLLEGLRRVSEGQRGGAFCRECGLPFLTLDARRASFCNDRERYRHGQRQRRVRMGLSAGRRGDPRP